MKVLTYLTIFTTCFITFVQAKDSDLMKDLSFKTSSGVTLNYLLFVPKNYDSSKKYPLVVTLHAVGSTYLFQVDNNDQAHPWIEDDVQAAVPHFIMAPGCPGGSWGGMFGAGSSLSQECKAVIEAIEDLKKQYTLDTNRFIIGGFSLGGAGTYHMIKFLPNYWAAACPVGAGGDSLQFSDASKIPTPIWHHQGSADNNGLALFRMSAALERNHYSVLQISSEVVVTANGSGPSNWTKEIQNGTKPKDIIFKNATPSYDTIARAVDAGANYIYQLITGPNHEMKTGASHEDSRINANHNPLLAKWAFSKRKGGPAVAIVPLPSRTAFTYNNNVSRTVLTTGNVSPATYVNNRIFTLLGQSDLQQPASGNSSVILRLCKPSVKK
jgi:dienelactone hydrolase